MEFIKACVTSTKFQTQRHILLQNSVGYFKIDAHFLRRKFLIIMDEED